MLYRLRHRYNPDTVLFEADCKSLQDTIRKALKEGVSLAGVDLSEQCLAKLDAAGGDFRGADFRGAQMQAADFSRGNLNRADLSGANMAGAFCRDTNFAYADTTLTNFYYADLNRAKFVSEASGFLGLFSTCFARADMDGATVEGEELLLPPITQGGLTWGVLITPKFLRIGCQRHTHERWATFTDAEIKEMTSDPCVGEFWATWKQALLSACAAHRAEHDARRVTALSKPKT